MYEWFIVWLNDAMHGDHDFALAVMSVACLVIVGLFI